MDPHTRHRVGARDLSPPDLGHLDAARINRRSIIWLVESGIHRKPAALSYQSPLISKTHDSREAGGLVNQSTVVARQLYEMIGLSGKSRAGYGRMKQVSTWMSSAVNFKVSRCRTHLMRAELLWRPCRTPGWEHHLQSTTNSYHTIIHSRHSTHLDNMPQFSEVFI